MCVIVMSDIFGVDYVTSDINIYWRMVSSSYGLCLIKFTYCGFCLIYWTLTFNPSVYWSEVKTDNIGVCIGLYKYSLFRFELFSFWSYWSDIFLIISKLSKSGLCISVKFTLRNF